MPHTAWEHREKLPGVGCQSRQLRATPNTLLILIHSDKPSVKYPNRWSIARSTRRQLLRNRRKGLESSADGMEKERAHGHFKLIPWGCSAPYNKVNEEGH